MKASKYLTRFYEAYNTLYFNGKLPKLKIGYGRVEPRTYGVTAFDVKTRRAICITISQTLHNQGWQCTELVTLLHEMVHVEMGPVSIKEGHGKEFQRLKRRLIVAGAFDELL